MYIYRELLTHLIDYIPKNLQIYVVYSSIDLTIILLTYLLTELLAFFLKFWLCSTFDYRLHTLTTIFFHWQLRCNSQS